MDGCALELEEDDAFGGWPVADCLGALDEMFFGAGSSEQGALRFLVVTMSVYSSGMCIIQNNKSSVAMKLPLASCLVGLVLCK